jgi:hypothetical protein
MESQNRPINFNGQTFYIGIDVHQKKWVISISNYVPYAV